MEAQELNKSEINQDGGEHLNTSKRKRFATRFIKALIIAVIFIIVLSIGQLMLTTLSIDRINQINGALLRFGFYMQFVRWLVYGALYIYWEELLRISAKLFSWPENVLANALAGKNMSLLIIVFVEVFIIQDFLSALV